MPDRLRLAIALAFVPGLAPAQARDTMAVLHGYVRDAVDSGAVAYAEVRLGNGTATRADGHGRYRITGIRPGDHEVTYRMLGYNAMQLQVALDPGLTLTSDVYLVRVPRLLTAMDVKGKSLRVPSGFESVYRRAARGQGHFVTREQIDSLNPRDIMGALNHFTPARRAYTGNGKFNRIESQRCEEFKIFLNGTPINANQMAVEEVLYSTPPGWIQAIEVYDSRVRMPVEFQPACGAVAIWTRTR